MRTSKKDFEKQLAQIKRRQARIHCIRQKIPDQPTKATAKCITPSIDEPYEVGETENHPENIFQFLQKNVDDPAIRVCL